MLGHGEFAIPRNVHLNGIRCTTRTDNLDGVEEFLLGSRLSCIARCARCQDGAELARRLRVHVDVESTEVVRERLLIGKGLRPGSALDRALALGVLRCRLIVFKMRILLLALIVRVLAVVAETGLLRGLLGIRSYLCLVCREILGRVMRRLLLRL